MFFLLTAVQKLFLKIIFKNQTSFSRVMITNVLPRFLMKHSVYLRCIFLKSLYHYTAVSWHNP